MYKLLSISLMLIMISLSAFAIDIIGSSTIQPITLQAGDVFMEKTGIEISVSGGGSGLGAKSAIDGTADIGACSRTLKPEEIEAGLISYTIGLDGIAIIVNGQNPMESITSEQVVAIFIGEIRNWNLLNEIDDDIVVISKEEGRSTGELFEKHFAIAGQVIEEAFLIGSNVEDIAFIAGDPHAIGYVSVGSAEYAVKQGANVKMLALDGTQASIENVRNKSYPLRRPLNLATMGRADDRVQRFIDFVMSDEGQNIVADNNFIRVK